MPQIVCDENHQWYVDGIKKPGVTRILNDMRFTDFSGVPADIMKRAQDFGTAVHTATELFDSDNLDFSSLDPALAPYIEAWDKFKRENGVEILEAEVELYSPTYNFCGKPDRLAIVRSQKTVLDIKSSEVMKPSTEIQTAGYEVLFNIPGLKRLGVQLKGDGTYKLYPYNNCSDRNTFLYALYVWWWLANNKLIKGW